MGGTFVAAKWKMGLAGVPPQGDGGDAAPYNGAGELPQIPQIGGNSIGHALHHFILIGFIS